MASDAVSLKCPHGPRKGDWESCSIPRLQLNRLSTQRYLPDPDLASTGPGLICVEGQTHADSHPIPHGDERVCFVSFLLSVM